MKIAILTMGTRGDVQPYAVLGRALKERGHDVVVSTAKNYAALVSSYGLDFRPVEADFQAVLDSEEGKKMMKANPFAIKRNLNKWVYPLISHSLSEFYTLAQQSDIVLYHVKTLADCFADQFPYKMIRASVLPIIEPTAAFANPAFSGFPIPKFLNKMTYRFTNLSLKLLSKPISAFRAQFNLPASYSLPRVKDLYGISAHFLPLPSDYTSGSQFSGFWYGVSDAPLAPSLQHFLDAGAPPLLLTFGSMPFQCQFDIQKAILTLSEQLDTRVIVVKGWGFDKTERLEASPRIKVIESAPYEALFPLVKAVVHHGGIGTTSECLRAGKPFMVCPILYPVGDQQFWGRWSHKKGVAVPPIPMRQLTEVSFIRSVAALLTETPLYEAAQQLQTALSTEDGLQKAISMIEKQYELAH